MPAKGYTRSRGDDFLRKAFDTQTLAASHETGVIVPTWNVSGRCQAPVYREIKYADYGEVAQGDIRTNLLKAGWRTNARTIELWTKCRKCWSCLRERSALWRRRAASEIEAASRTWFATLTLSPAHHHWIALRARQRLLRGGTNFDALTADEQFAERHREVSLELTKWLKRVRKNSGATLRIMVVCERHKSGLPHYHALLHEVNDHGVRHKVLAKSWPLGFTNFKLVTDKRAASYVAKYLSKAATARVRASAFYGTQVRLDESTVMCVKSSDTPPDKREGGLSKGSNDGMAYVRTSNRAGAVSPAFARLSKPDATETAGATCTDGTAPRLLWSARSIRCPAVQRGEAVRTPATPAPGPEATFTTSDAWFNWLSSRYRVGPAG